MPTISRLPFLLAVALVAAALGDAVVESISNSGVFGRGYADDVHAGVVPTLVAGGLIALEFARRRCMEIVRRGDARRRSDWILDLARRYSPGSPGRDLAFVFCLQLLTLFAMETAEQLAFGGKLLGGTAWLGGPIAFSLIAHALICVGCTFALAWFARTTLATVALFVRSALEFIVLAIARATAHLLAGRSERVAHRRMQDPHARQSGDRAPPTGSFVPA